MAGRKRADAHFGSELETTDPISGRAPGVRLVLFNAHTAVSLALLSEGTITVGRSPGRVSLALEDSSLSRVHAEVRITSSVAGEVQVLVTDLQSRNGVVIAGRRLSPGVATKLALGVPAELGDTRLTAFSLARSPERGGDTADTGAGRDAASEGIIARSPAMVEVLERVRRAAASRVPVLFLGETGVGKGVLAERLHALSPRAARVFVRLDCAAVPENLIESELFGHEAGAFTSASSAKPGLVESAAGGTLFLDEIGDLPLAAQAKLLGFIETRRCRRLGGVEDREIDARILLATKHDLAKAVREGRFRDDLYYRISLMPVKVPALRDRREDIAPLVDAFGSRFHREEGAPGTFRISPAARAKLEAYAWPGNLRQLANVVHRAVLLGDGDELSDIRFEEDEELTSGTAAPRSAASGSLHIRELERDAVVRALEATAGNQRKAAVLLGISRRKLMSLLDRHQVARPRKTRSTKI